MPTQRSHVPIRTPEYRAAVAALMALDDDLRDAACAEVLARSWRLRADWRYDSKRDELRWWGWLRGKPRPEIDRHAAKHRWRDHVECRQSADGARYFISHPYGVGHDDLRTLMQFCTANKLRCSIGAGSWYYPGSTVVIIVQPQEQSTAGLRSAA
jgi:hypothetical protein